MDFFCLSSICYSFATLLAVVWHPFTEPWVKNLTGALNAPRSAGITAK